MIKHIVMWKFKEGEHDNMLIFRDRLLALKGQIPEIRAMEVGINMNPSDRSFDAVLVSEFDSLEALKDTRDDTLAQIQGAGVLLYAPAEPLLAHAERGSRRGDSGGYHGQAGNVPAPRRSPVGRPCGVQH